jgi:hypothetical protein
VPVAPPGRSRGALRRLADRRPNGRRRRRGSRDRAAGRLTACWIRRGKDDAADPLARQHLEVRRLLLGTLVGVAEEDPVAAPVGLILGSTDHFGEVRVTRHLARHGVDEAAKQIQPRIPVRRFGALPDELGRLGAMLLQCSSEPLTIPPEQDSKES